MRYNRIKDIIEKVIGYTTVSILVTLLGTITVAAIYNLIMDI